MTEEGATRRYLFIHRTRHGDIASLEIASNIMAAYFDHLPQYSLAVCRQCGYGVLPSHAESHLRRAHRVHQKDAELIAAEIGGWAGLVEYASGIQVPEAVVEPIPELPVFEDGLLCQIDPHGCRQITRSAERMRKHWQKKHAWLVAGKGGRPSRADRQQIEERMKKGCQRIHCQRLLVQGTGSQYFEVRRAVNSETVPVNRESAWEQLGQEMEQTWAKIEERAQTTIEEGERDEANPWLERTQWLKYLEGIDRPSLLASIDEPIAEPEPRHDQEAEPVEAAIWAAMNKLAQISQSAVVDRVGVFVRMEAIRTEKHQTRYQPLQPYMDIKAVIQHTRPWQQILMFFARTQREHAWQSPPYRFTKRQQAAWDTLVREAGGSVGEETEEEAEDEGEDEIEDKIEDEIEEEMEEAGEADDDERNHTHTPNPEVDPARKKPRGLSGIQKACLEFCIALLNQSITRREYDSPFVCALAVLGVREDGWRGPELYPPILSSIIKIARFMVVQQALELSDPFDEEEFDSDSAYESDDNSTQRCQRQGCLQLVQKMMDKFMVRGSHSPMQWMLDLRTYGLKIHYNTTSRGHVEWVGQDELLYKNIQFTMTQFRSMVHGLTAAARQMLTEELMLSNCDTEPVPSIPWSHLRDDPTNAKIGWNFLQDQRTRLPVDGDRWLFERVGRNAHIQGKFMKPGTPGRVNRKGVEQYMDRVVAFREKLIVLMHIVGGQPARGPEIMSIRHSNTRKGGHRNIFVEDGMMVFVTRYHKGYQMSGDVKIIHRYIPREVGELLVWYMWLVLPFQRRLEAMVWEKETMSSHMWPADPSGRKWTSDRFREALKRESQLGMGQPLTIAAYREIAIGISRRFMRDTAAFKGDEGEDGEVSEDNMAAVIADEQSGHTAHVAGMIYAREVMEMAGATADRRRLFRQSSTDWHQFLGFEVDGECKKRKRAPFECEANEARIDRRSRLRKMDTKAALQRMMGGQARFRGVQEKAIQAIVAGESPVVAVMPTGAGKSMLFMLPAWAEQGGTTVVVVPLIALRGDMTRRCKALGISCVEWEAMHPPDGAAVVLVTPESAVGEAFATFLNRLRALRQLDRIVIDECHMVLNRQYDFRKQMQHLGKLVAAETQMVLLTATLPPSEEEELYRRMHFERDQVKIFRADTTRKNIAYRVVTIGKKARQKEADQVVLRIVQQKQQQYPTGKMIVYGNDVAKVKRIAAKLGCHAYHSKATGKAGKLQDFMDGQHQVIVATSALGMGVDIPDIRCVVHMDWPFSMLDYAQESGRAGRDGLRSEAIMIVQQGKQRAVNDSDPNGKADQELVRRFVGEEGGRRCRRIVLGEYLDRRDRERTGCEEGEETCDVCHSRQEAEEDGEGEAQSSVDEEVESVCEDEEVEIEIRRILQQQDQARQGPRRTWMQQSQRQFEDIEWVAQQLARWTGRCGFCEGRGYQDSMHDIRECPHADSNGTKEAIGPLDQKIRFEPWSGCFTCGGVPQSICQRWEPNGRGQFQRREGGDCQHKGVLSGTVIGIIFGYEGVMGQWIRRLEQLGVGREEGQISLVQYIGQKQKVDLVECNQLVAEFCWLTRLVSE
jgi:RecQ family ATP-dependent DNA helicase